MDDFAKSVEAALIVALLVLGGSTARAVENEAMPKRESETGFVPYSSIGSSGNPDGVRPFDGLPKPLRGFIIKLWSPQAFVGWRRLERRSPGENDCVERASVHVSCFRSETGGIGA